MARRKSKQESTKKQKEDEEEEIHDVPNSRRKLRTTACLLMFFGMGLTNAVHGPTLVNLKELLNTDMVHLSLAMTMISIGYLVSAILCGLIFHRFDSELQFCIACLLESISLMAAPWSRDIYGFMAACAVTGFAMAYIDTGGNAVILSLWSNHRAKEPLLQSMHFIWSVGSTLSPFLIRPFLVDSSTLYCPITNSSVRHNEGALNISTVAAGGIIEEMDSTDDRIKHLKSSANPTAIDSIYDILGDNMSMSDNRGSSVNATPCSDNDLSDHDITLVRYAYVLVGGIVFLVALLYMFIYCYLGHHIWKRKISTDTHTTIIDEYDYPSCFKFGFFVLLFIFSFLNVLVESMGGSYISVFVIEGLGWSVKRGATITAGYWGAHGVGRLLGVGFSMFISPKLMLFLCITCTGVGYGTLCFTGLLPDEAVYAAVMLTGLGMSTVFPNMMLWVSKYLTSASILSAVCVAGGTMGPIVGYPLIGTLMETLESNCFVYTLLASTVLMFIVLVIMHVYSLAAVRRPRTLHAEPLNEL